MSTILLAQLLQLHATRTIDIFNVTAEIKLLEGASGSRRTQKEGMFKLGTPLQGLYKKHFTDARFIVRNLAAEFGYLSGGNKKLADLIGRLVHEHKGQLVNEGFGNILAHELTIGGFDRRAMRCDLTGEWIIYKKFKGRRYYLCLAAHDEPNDQIRVRVDDAIRISFRFLDTNL